MSDALEQVLRLVADGHLTAAQAAPILDALGMEDPGALSGADGLDGRAAPGSPDRTGSEQGTASAIRIEVSEGGRRIINRRIPVSLGRLALDQVPGLSGANVELVRQALADGRSGVLLDIDDEGDGVRIALE